MVTPNDDNLYENTTVQTDTTWHKGLYIPIHPKISHCRNDNFSSSSQTPGCVGSELTSTLRGF